MAGERKVKDRTIYIDLDPEDFLKEKWKPIKGYRNYEVSNLGRVRNTDTNRIRCQQKRKSGYVKVSLYKNNIEHTYDVHRLVAEAFVPNPKNFPEVNHKHGNKADNRASELEWTTRHDNMRHAISTGLFVPKAPEPIRKPIRIIETGEVFASISDCAKAINSSVINIVNVMREEETTHHSAKSVHFELISQEEYNKITAKKSKPFLYDFQMDAVKKCRNGSILNGSVGSGKSRTGLFYYFKENGGWIEGSDYTPMKNPQNLYIITTAKKRDSLEWDQELAFYRLSTNPDLNYYKNKVVVDSWNNIKKYIDYRGAFFIFDEDRVTGSGAWVKAFLKIAKFNNWIILSATPADVWNDYWAVFVANGFYKNKTEFQREHIVYSRYTKYPQIDRYINIQRLERLRDRILVDMVVQRHTKPHHEDVYCNYDIPFYKDVFKKRWDPFKNEPIKQASSLCYILRRIVNMDESRQVALLELLEDHPKAIIFYNFDYERDILLNLSYAEGTKIAEWSGHAHQPVPTSDKWVYLTQYTSGCEGWNCITCDTIIFYSQNYSYKVMTQAAGRIDRLNTKFIDLYYYHLKSRSGIDLAISKALKEKKQFNETRWLNSWK